MLATGGELLFFFQHHVQTVDAPEVGFCWEDFELSSSWILDSPRGYNMKKNLVNIISILN